MRAMILLLVIGSMMALEINEIELVKVVSKDHQGLVSVHLYYKTAKPDMVEIDVGIIENGDRTLFGTAVKEGTLSDQMGIRVCAFEINVKYLERLIIVVVPHAGKIHRLQLQDIKDKE